MVAGGNVHSKTMEVSFKCQHCKNVLIIGGVSAASQPSAERPPESSSAATFRNPNSDSTSLNESFVVLDERRGNAGSGRMIESFSRSLCLAVSCTLLATLSIPLKPTAPGTGRSLGESYVLLKGQQVCYLAAAKLSSVNSDCQRDKVKSRPALILRHVIQMLSTRANLRLARVLDI